MVKVTATFDTALAHDVSSAQELIDHFVAENVMFGRVFVVSVEPSEVTETTPVDA